nr:MAG TPA: hypothetical protein [Caudoviricetes sp.]
MTENEAIKTPDGSVLTPIDNSDLFEAFKNNLQLDNSLAEKVREQMYENLNLYNTPNIPDIQSPEERLKFLTNKLDSMNSELKSQTESMNKIRYENMKLNAQIEVLNKTIDSNLKELNKLRNVNSELKAMNKNLIDSNRHYWRNTTIISLTVAIISFILGMFSNEVRALLLSIL